MRITRRQLRQLIEHVLTESTSGERMHRCFHGALVPFGSQECLDDISSRMDDARSIRDECDNRTDKRDYYNGVLKVLRREMRDAQRVQGLSVESDSDDGDLETDDLLLDKDI